MSIASLKLLLGKIDEKEMQGYIVATTVNVPFAMARVVRYRQSWPGIAATPLSASG
jgi:hypothetical protein